MKRSAIILLMLSGFLSAAAPSLRFTGATSHRVDDGGGTSGSSALDDADTTTICAWAYIASTGAGMRISTKGGSTNYRIVSVTAGAAFNGSYQRSTTDAQAQAALSNFTAYGTGKWIYMCSVIDIAGGAVNADQKLYIGDVTTPAAEPSSYSTQTVGSGTHTSDASNNIIVGNREQADVSWNQDICSIVVYKARLSQDDIRKLQFNMHAFALSPTMPALIQQLGVAKDVGTQPDWSGNAFNGTITGATGQDHCPIPHFVPGVLSQQ